MNLSTARARCSLKACSWRAFALSVLLTACGTPAAQHPSGRDANTKQPSRATKEPSTANADEQSLKNMHGGCVSSCLEAEGTEELCDQVCTCVMTGLRKDPAAMRALSEADVHAPPSAGLQKAMGGISRRCSESIAQLPQKPYDPRALRALLGTKVNVATDHTPAPKPPAKLFEKVSYPAPLGPNVAYVSPVKNGTRRPAILWLAGGFDWSINDAFWLPSSRSNDQSARAFRDAGIVLMLPALRGSNENPGHNECFFGEVEDVLTAADFLAKRPDVDPKRIYLGGHSTGATLALLAAESTKRFRAVFAFGPVADPRQYGKDGCLPDGLSDAELVVRAPLSGMDQLTTPTFIIEGSEQGNSDTFPDLRKHAHSTVQFLEVPGATHFSVLSPGTEVIARAILADTAEEPQLAVSVQNIASRMAPDH